MSAKQNTRSSKTALSVPAISPAEDVLHDLDDYYGYFRQRAAEKPLQTRVLSRVRKRLSADEKESWRAHGELKRNTLMTTINSFISHLESDPRIDLSKRLSVAQTVWSMLQIELGDAHSALHLERIASEFAAVNKGAKHARLGRKLDTRKTI